MDRLPEKNLVRFARGTFAAIDAVRNRWHSRADFIRMAVADEIERRKAPPEPKPDRVERPAPARAIALSKKRRAAVAKKNRGK